MFTYFSSILCITFDTRGVLSLMRILRGSGEAQRITQMLPIALQARHIIKMLGHIWINKPPSLGAGGRFEFSCGRCSDRTNLPTPNSFSSPNYIESLSRQVSFLNFSGQILPMEIASEDLYTSAERFVEVNSFDARWNPPLKSQAAQSPAVRWSSCAITVMAEL